MLNGTHNKKMLPEYQNNKFDLAKTKSIDLPDDCFFKIKDDLKYCGYLMCGLIAQHNGKLVA